MSSPRTCLNCGRTMFTPSGFCPPSPGSLMVSTLSQCTECHDKGLPDLDPPRPLGVGKDVVVAQIVAAVAAQGVQPQQRGLVIQFHRGR